MVIGSPMQRVAAADVLAIRPTTLDPEPFILAASLFVDAHIVEAEWPLPVATEIERWLTAHFMAVAEGSGLAERRVGDTTIRYHTPKVGLGLDATLYGQQVLLLDTTGTLAGAGVTGGGEVVKRATIDVF
jgi:hypothetical protein